MTPGNQQSDTKTCSNCMSIKPAVEFTRWSQCDACRLANMKQYRESHRDEMHAAKARWQADNAAKNRAYVKAYRERKKAKALWGDLYDEVIGNGI